MLAAKTLGEGPSYLFELLGLPVIPSVPWLVESSLQPLSPSSHHPLHCFSLFPLSSLMRTCVIGFRAHQLIWDDHISRSLITSAKAFSPRSRYTFQMGHTFAGSPFRPLPSALWLSQIHIHPTCKIHSPPPAPQSGLYRCSPFLSFAHCINGCTILSSTISWCF